MDDRCVEVFDEMKLGHRHRYAIFAMNKEQDVIVVERILEKKYENQKLSPQEKYRQLLDVLIKKQADGDCCYAVYDAEYIRRNGQRRSKIIFIVW